MSAESRPPVKRYKDVYGKWGYQKGEPVNYMLCAEEVPSGWTRKQCSRKCGHGPEAAYCKQHAKAHAFEL